MPVEDLVEKARRAISEYGLMSSGDEVLVAVSGGPDSMALLNVLQSLTPELKLSLSVFHLNHGLRGRESDSDEAFVEGQTTQRGLPLYSRRVDVRSERRPGESLEEAARRVRYSELEKVAAEKGIDRVALGHNADDQVETFVMRVLRGSGLEGLCSIPVSRGIFVRPLIGCPRAAIERYCLEAGVAYVVDRSNVEPVFLRNRLRLEALPALDRLAPGWRRKVGEIIETLKTDASYLATLSEEVARRLLRVREGEVRLGVDDLEGLPLALRGRLLREAGRQAAGGKVSLELRHVKSVLSRVEKKGNFSLQLPGGLVAFREYGELVMVYRPEEPVDYVEAELPVPGVLDMPGIGLAVESELLRMEDMARRAVGRSGGGAFECRICGDRGAAPGGLSAGHLDIDSLALPLVLRTWRPGDRFRPLGLEGTKKIHDYLVDRKVPRSRRKKILVLESGGDVAWVVGGEIADWAKIVPGTRRVLHVTARPVR